MQDPTINELKNLSKPRISIALLNGYYLSFLAIGLLAVILKSDASTDLKQGLFFILLCLIAGSFNLLKDAAYRQLQEDVDDRTTQTVVYGDYYDNSTYNTSNKSITDIKMETPSNYFDVIKTIELVPDSPNPDRPGIKDVLIKLQSYVEADSTLVRSEKESIFELIKQMAVEAKSDPINNDLTSAIELIQQADRNSKYKSRLIQVLKDSSMQVFDELSPPVMKIVITAIQKLMKD